MATELKKKINVALTIIFWILVTAVIITAAHVTLHLSKVAAVLVNLPLPGAFALFFVPFFCAFVLPFVANIEEVKVTIISAMLAGFIAIALIALVFYTPELLGFAEPTPDYSALVIKDMLVSALGILPGVVVGSTLGGAFATP